MTQDEARKTLAETWRFSRVGELIALREVALIEALREHEAAQVARLSTPLNHVQPQLSRVP